jgi:hypothetical protein
MVLTIWPKQAAALESPADELFFGGAAGGGKSHYLRVDAIKWCMQVPGLQAYLFRRLYIDLKLNHMEGPQGFPVLLAPLIAQKLCAIVGGEIRFWNGSKIYLRHLQTEQSILKYMGAEIHWLGMDELTHFVDTQYRQIRGRCRVVGLPCPTKAHTTAQVANGDCQCWRGVLPRIRLSGNPGNIGHHWVKKTFVDPGPMVMHRASEEEGGALRCFIPSSITDNPSLLKQDPGYINKLKGLGDPLLIRALLEGDWEVVAGSMFGDVWRKELHTCDEFPIPAGWELWRGGDDGYSAPLAYYWFTQDPVTKTIYVIDELYRKGMLPEAASEETLKRDHQLRIRRANGHVESYGMTLTGLLDDEAFTRTGVSEKDRDISRGDAMNARGCRWVPVDKGKGSRVQRVQHLHRLLAPNENDPRGMPGVRFFRRCENAIRTIPTLPRDKHKIEDVDSEAEDHAFDGVTYGLKWKRHGAKRVAVVGF